LIEHLGLGFATALTWGNLFYCLIGVFLGTLIGVLPGLGPTATIAMLLPITFTLPRVRAHYAGGHLLRVAIRRLHHRHSRQPARRSGIGGHHPRRLPDGAAGSGGS